jgi:hypothetical protein
MSAENRPEALTAEERLDGVAGSVLDGKPVDWELVETRNADAGDVVVLRELRDLQRLVDCSRSLQRRLEPHAAGIPEQWGHLTLLELARAGSSGEIWRAWDKWLQREVALKFLFTLDEDRADGSALLEEARPGARPPPRCRGRVRDRRACRPNRHVDGAPDRQHSGGGD